MAKLDFARLSRPEAVTETRTLTDWLQPDSPLELTLSARPDVGVQTLAMEAAQKYIAQYITGEQGRPAVPFPPIADADGTEVPVYVTRSLFQSIGRLFAIQTGADRYNVMEWVVISVMMPNAFIEAANWANELFERAMRIPQGDEPPNSSAAAGDTSSAPPPSSTSNTPT
jgi:hypothetical protein